MSRKRKLLITSCLLGVMIAICGTTVACSNKVTEPPKDPVPEENTETPIPEGVVNFDETWLDE